MKRLGRAVRQQSLGGKPLPRVLQGIPDIRRSEVTMIAGEPGSGKSLLALWHALAWAETHNLRGIYYSADSAELGQAARALAMTKMNLSVTEAEELFKRNDPIALDAMWDLNNLAWSFEDDLSYDNINDETEAFTELWGSYPDFIIVDNLTDVEGQADDEWATQRRSLKALVQLARHTDSATLVLHHTSEEFKANPCPPRKAIQGKCSQKPALILTIADRGPKRPVAVVKNRFGQADKTGETAIWFSLDEDTLHWRF